MRLRLHREKATTENTVHRVTVTTWRGSILHRVWFAAVLIGTGVASRSTSWHFICVARQESVEAARKNFIPIEGDSRVPMAEVHQLFAGKIEPEAVLEAAINTTASELARRNHLCYAHLYLGLYFEALSEPKKSREHMKKAAIDYKMDHYMGKTAQVHWHLRQKQKK